MGKKGGKPAARNEASFFSRLEVWHQGFAKGEANTGFNEAVEKGKTKGHAKGFAEGFMEGKGVGYWNGLEDGKERCKADLRSIVEEAVRNGLVSAGVNTQRTTSTASAARPHPYGPHADRVDETGEDVD